VRIKVERSGGLAGIPLSNEIDEKDLPPPLIHTAKKIIEDKKSPSLSMKLSPTGAADHYSYKISILDGTIKRVIECNQFQLQDDLRSLVKYVEKHHNKVTK
jgi:hypothetical protein